ncbi:hypothetical protein G4B88_020780 [Cannabis sativa]|uniref:Uncharacterized protein n=1 Tax=Cannabis sativa TaxID=3483 RepID=A0A7J6HLS3_CANSA|nr:hypothetical protein G4B88_020780 [Cannabis sativa]
MEKLLERLETFEKQRDILDLQEGVENMLTQRPPSIFHHLNELKEEACLKLFVKIIARNKGFTMESNLKKFGKEISFIFQGMYSFLFLATTYELQFQSSKTIYII